MEKIILSDGIVCEIQNGLFIHLLDAVNEVGKKPHFLAAALMSKLIKFNGEKKSLSFILSLPLEDASLLMQEFMKTNFPNDHLSNPLRELFAPSLN